jgi:geranylgeranyl diphosphate synthase, type II
MPTDRNSVFLERLKYYREMALKCLREWLPTKESHRYLYALVREYLDGSGKGLRPALCMATCSAFGGKVEHALNSAAAIELMHNAFLIHDDIEDGSEFRRTQRTMHTRYGVPIAVNTGDAMQALSMRLLRKNMHTLGPQVAWQIFDEFDHMLMETLEGQAMELGWIRDNRCDISDEDYLRMTLKKTCWYSFIHPCRIGALIARPQELDLDRFNPFGYFLGAAFQIQDDILNLTGSQQKYGKEIGGDLYEGKRTLMLSHLFGKCSEQEKKSLLALLSRPRHRRLPREIDSLNELLTEYGSIEYALSCAQELRDAAEKAFLDAYRDAPETDDKEFIRQCLHYMLERTA